MVTEMSRKDWIQQGKELYGDNPAKFEFKCTGCKKVQSYESIQKQMKKGIGSQRYGVLSEGDEIHLECDCYQPDCNWTANGLFHSGKLIIFDPSKPHNAQTKENCYYVFPYAAEEEKE